MTACIPCFAARSGESPDEIVGLPAGASPGAVGHYVTPEHPLHPGDLDDQASGGLGTMRLVVGGRPRVTKGRLRRIEHDRQVAGRNPSSALAEHAREPVNGVGREPLAVGQLADGVEGTVEVVGAVDEVDRPLGRADGRSSGRADPWSVASASYGPKSACLEAPRRPAGRDAAAEGQTRGRAGGTRSADRCLAARVVRPARRASLISAATLRISSGSHAARGHGRSADAVLRCRPSASPDRTGWCSC